MMDTETAMDQFYAAMDAATDMFSRRDTLAICDMHRAALARAEAAEAEAGQLRDELAAMTERVTFARRAASLAENALETARSRWDEAERREKSIFDAAMDIADERNRLAARVAELEHESAELRTEIVLLIADVRRVGNETCPCCGIALTDGNCEECDWPRRYSLELEIAAESLAATTAPSIRTVTDARHWALPMVEPPPDADTEPTP